MQQPEISIHPLIGRLPYLDLCIRQKNCYPTLYYKHSIEQVGIRSRVTN